MSSSHQAEAGFTLLEILVVTVVFGLLAIALWQGVSVGTKGWATQEKNYTLINDVQGAENALRRLIARAERSDSEQLPSLAGLHDRLHVVSWLPGEAGYQRDVEAALGVDTEHRLILGWKRFRRAQCDEATAPYHKETLLSDVKAVSFSYYGQKEGRYVWQTVWTGNALPRLVSIHIEFIKSGRTWPDIVIRPFLADEETQ